MLWKMYTYAASYVEVFTNPVCTIICYGGGDTIVTSSYGCAYFFADTGTFFSNKLSKLLQEYLIAKCDVLESRLTKQSPYLFVHLLLSYQGLLGQVDRTLRPRLSV